RLAASRKASASSTKDALARGSRLNNYRHTVISTTDVQRPPGSSAFQPTSSPFCARFTASVGQVYGSRQNACRCGGVETTPSPKARDETTRSSWLSSRSDPFQRSPAGPTGPPFSRSVSTSSTLICGKTRGREKSRAASTGLRSPVGSDSSSTQNDRAGTWTVQPSALPPGTNGTLK